MAPKDAVSEQPWQLSCSDLKERGAALLASAHWADCAFKVGSSCERVAAHRLILASASPVFAAMLYGPLAGERDRDITIPDVEMAVFKLLLQYVYTDELEIPSCSVACDLYYAAQKYMLSGLVAECSSYLTSRLEPETACQAYELALCMQDTVLLEKSITVIKVRTKEVLTAPSFVDAQIDTIAAIFAMDTLNVDSEMELIEAAERYACSQYENTLQSMLSEDRDDMDSKVTAEMLNIRTVIQQIRFLTLTAEEFEKYAPLSTLLSEVDISAISANIVNKDAPESMPCGFSASRTPRKKPSTEEALDPNTFRVRIENIQDLQHFSSKRHKLHGLKWKLDAVEGENGPYFTLKSGRDEISKPVRCVEMRFLRPGLEPICLTEDQGLRTDFTASWEWFSVLEWEELLDPGNGYLVDGALTVEVYAEKACKNKRFHYLAGD